MEDAVAVSVSIQRPTKLGTCTRCRSAKVKCRRLASDETEPCERCLHLGLTCEFVRYRPGRKHGSKNRIKPPGESAFSSPQKGISRSSEPADLVQSRKESVEISSQLFWSQTSEAISTIPTFTDQRHVTQSELNPLGFTHAVESQPGSEQSSARRPSEHVDIFGLPRSRLDLGSDKDPISLGLVTYTKAQRLFDYYHSNLTHIRFGLDPQLHTLEFTRCRSSLLLTSIMAAAAKFVPGEMATETRLSSHVKKLVDLVICHGYKSVEIAFAFLVLTPWLSFGEHNADDPTAQYAALCVNMALDLHMDKTPVFTEVHDTRIPARLSIQQILVIDGLNELGLTDLMICRIIKWRQRAWYCVFLADRAVALARGRPCLAPIGHPITECDTWLVQKPSAPIDTVIISKVALQRDLGPLLDAVRTMRAGIAMMSVDTLIIALVNEFFSSWHAKWDRLLLATTSGDEIPAYSSIGLAQTKLSIYAALLGSCNSRHDPTLPLLQATRQAAMEMLQVAISKQAWLSAMTNQSVIMIAFAASWLIKDYQQSVESNPNIGPLGLEQLATVLQVLDILQRVGTEPSHRNGYAVLYSTRLRALLWFDGRQNGKPASQPPGNNPPMGHLSVNHDTATFMSAIDPGIFTLAEPESDRGGGDPFDWLR